MLPAKPHLGFSGFPGVSKVWKTAFAGHRLLNWAAAGACGAAWCPGWSLVLVWAVVGAFAGCAAGAVGAVAGGLDVVRLWAGSLPGTASNRAIAAAVSTIAVGSLVSW